MNRRSIRMYKDMPVEREKLQLIAECGVNAPNGMNSQPWELRIVDDVEMIDAISDSYRRDNPGAVERDPNFRNMFRNAPAVIFIAVPEGEDGLNAGLLGENICLSAYSLGLGTVCLGGPVGYLKNSEAGKAFLERLDFSEGYDLLYMIGSAIPTRAPRPSPAIFRRSGSWNRPDFADRSRRALESGGFCVYLYECSPTPKSRPSVRSGRRSSGTGWGFSRSRGREIGLGGTAPPRLRWSKGAARRGCRGFRDVPHLSVRDPVSGAGCSENA